MNCELILCSYEILSDPAKREDYNNYGLEGLAGGSGVDPSDLFEMFAHSGFSFAFGGPPPKRKAKDSTIPYDVTLEDLYNGKQVKLNMEKDVICSTCNGSVAFECSKGGTRSHYHRLVRELGVTQNRRHASSATAMDSLSRRHRCDLKEMFKVLKLIYFSTSSEDRCLLKGDRRARSARA